MTSAQLPSTWSRSLPRFRYPYGKTRRECVTLPPRALFIASSILRNSKLSIHVPKSRSPQNVSEDLVLTYFQQVWNEADTSALAKLCAKEMVLYDPSLWHDPFLGQEKVTRVIEEYLSAFKLYRYTYIRALGSPDGKEVLAHWSARAAQLGDLWNRPPTGAIEEINGMTRFVINGNKIHRIDTFRERMQHELGAGVDHGY